MRLHRFYLENENFETLTKGDIFICRNEAVVGQISRVLRAQAGDRMRFFNVSGECECVIDTIGKKDIFCTVTGYIEPLIQNKKVILVQSLIKKDKFEWVAQKATELGVTDIYPVISERSEKRGLDENRLGKIMIEATEQSGWGSAPVLHPINKLAETFIILSKEKVVLYLLDMDGEKYIKNNSSVAVAIFIGPEGGWSEQDKALFKANSVQTISLGRSVLRAETAAVVGVFTYTQ